MQFFRHNYIWIIMISLLSFMVGWSKFWLSEPYVYYADYVLRVFLIWLLASVWVRSDFAWKVRLNDFIVVGAICLIYMYVYEIFDGLPIEAQFDQALFQPVGYPKIENIYLRLFDLMIGLFLVAISEEGVFRLLFSKLATVRQWSRTRLYLISSVWFAFIHLPQGLTSVLSGFFWGLLFMYFYRRTQSFLFVVFVHFLINLWYFGSWYFAS
jgi:membrane protease YdiL (CAAX protease family)